MKKRKVYKFNNGATIIYQKDNRLNYSAVEVGFVCGSEKNEQNGVAHFVEHMMFKKTKNLSLDEINKQRSVITSLNACTSRARLTIDFCQTNRLFEKAIKLSADMLLNSCYDESQIENEKKVIEEEYLRKLDKLNQSASMQAYYAFTDGLSPEKTLGSKEDLNKITKESLQNYKQQNFCSNNFVFSYCGNFGFGKIKKMVKKHFLSQLKEDEAKKNEAKFVKVLTNPQLILHKNDKKQIEVLCGFIHSQDDSSDYEKDLNYLLTRYLLFGVTQYRNNLRKEGLVYSATCYDDVYYGKEDNALFYFTFATSKEKLKSCFEIIKTSITGLLAGDISDEEFMDIKNNKIYSYDENHSSTKDIRAYSNLTLALKFGGLKKQITTKKKIKSILKLTKEDFINYVHKVFGKTSTPYVTIVGDVNVDETLSYEEIKNIFK